MNKISKSLLAVGAACALAVTSFAAGNMISISVDPSVKILVNGAEFKPKDANGNDVMTFIYNGTTYAPLRALAEAYGLEVGYDAARNMATVSEPGKVYDNYDTPYAPVYQKPVYDTYTEKYTSGQYKVGQDIPAGKYIVLTDESDGYFMVSSDANGDDILFNDFFENHSIIQIKQGDYLDLDDCYVIPYSDDYPLPLPSKDYDSGTYIVGVHIPAGEYKVSAIRTDRSGYYSIYNNLRRDDLIANDYFDGTSYVKLTDGDCLIMERCEFID